MKNKQKANIICLISFIALIASHILFSKTNFVIFLWLRIAVEGILIGSIADWFAVTAIFRKPLGFPFHTQIIIRYKQKILRAIVDGAFNHLLGKDFLQKNISKYLRVECIMKAIPQNILLDKIRGLINNALILLSQHLSNYNELSHNAISINKVIERAFSTEIITKLILSNKILIANKLCSYFCNKIESILNQPSTLELIESYLVEFSTNQKKADNGFLKKLTLNILEVINVVNYHDGAKSIVKVLKTYIVQRREYLINLFIDLLERLFINNNIGFVFIDKIRQIFLSQLFKQEHLNTVVSSVLSHDKLCDKINASISWCVNNKMIQSETISFINKHVQNLALDIIENDSKKIIHSLEIALQRLSDDAVVDLIESRAGNQLQWIRINGAILGGLLSLLIYFVKVIILELRYL